MANRKKCGSLGVRLAQSVFSTQYQRQVLPLTYLSQYSGVSEQFKTQTRTLNSPKKFFSSSPTSVIEVLLSNAWSEVTKKQLEESNFEISHEFVVYVLKKLDKDPQKAFEFFNWACREKSFQPNTLTYSLLVKVLADLRSMKQFWGAIEEMLEKGFYLDEGTYMMIAGRLKKAKLDKDVIALKHFNQRMIQENAKDDEGTDMVKLILASDWNEEVENKLNDLKIDVTDNLLMRVLKKIRHDPLKAYHFFEWVGKCQGCQQSSVAYNVMARILAQSDTIKEFQNVIMDMRSKGHGMDYDTYIKISRSLQKNKMLKEVVELYEYMMDGPYPLSARDCILILRSIYSSTDVNLTSMVVKKFEAGGNTLSKADYDSIHRSLIKFGNFDEAEKIVETMKNAGYEPDNNTYNQLIFGLRKAGRLEDACKVLEEMEANGCDPNIVTWTILITGLCYADQMDMALLYFAKMMEKNIDPDAYLLGVLVKGFIAQKKLDGAYKLVVEMVKKANLKPWQATYKLLTEKLLEARKLDEALKIVSILKRHGYPPFTEAFVLHISKFGTVEDAKRLLASLSVKQLPSASAHLLVLKSFKNEGRHFEAKDILYSGPHIRSHREGRNLVGATESSSTVPASHCKDSILGDIEIVIHH